MTTSLTSNGKSVFSLMSVLFLWAHFQGVDITKIMRVNEISRIQESLKYVLRDRSDGSSPEKDLLVILNVGGIHRTGTGDGHWYI